MEFTVMARAIDAEGNVLFVFEATPPHLIEPTWAALSDIISALGGRLGNCGEGDLPPARCKTVLHVASRSWDTFYGQSAVLIHQPRVVMAWT